MQKYFKNKGYHIRNYNFKIVLYAFALSILGVFIVKSATINEVSSSFLDTTQKQILGVVLGMIAMIAFSIMDYHFLIKFAIPIYILNILLLIYVKYIGGSNYLGAKRWIHLPGFGTVQPSEFSKVAVIIMAAYLIVRFKNKISNVFYLLFIGAILTVSLLLILVEPDLSTTLVIIVGIAMMIFVGGISRKWIIGIVSVFAVALGLLLSAVYQPEQKVLNHMVETGVLQDYQLNRINAYFFPDEHIDLVRQQKNSVMAIGSGQLSGKGLNTSTYESVKNGNFLSEEQCDFIFAVVGEELGFVGCCFIILFLLLIVIEAIRIASRAKAFSGKLIASGIGAMLAFQSFVNIGVSTLILPNTGTPLPFVSAGLSSLLSTFLMMGILLNIGLQRKNRL